MTNPPTVPPRCGCSEPLLGALRRTITKEHRDRKADLGGTMGSSWCHPAEASWTVLDSVGAKRYLDDTVPIGTTAAHYRVRAKRGNHTSAANEAITVRLGVEPQTGQRMELAA